MKRLIRFIFLICFGCCLMPLSLWATPLQDTIIQVYKGHINQQYSITLELKVLGKKCWGHCYYDKYMRPLELSGTVDEQTIRFEEQHNKKLTGYFEGNLQDDYQKVVGTWTDRKQQKKLPFELRAIQTSHRVDFKKVIDFQDFLNHFDALPKLPIHLEAGLFYTEEWAWQNSPFHDLDDFKRFIPYPLAAKYVMQQVNWKTEGSLDYFNIPEEDYKEYKMGYRAIGKMRQTPQFVSLLAHFDADTGWDDYEVFFMLNFDYEGNLLDAIPVFKHIVLERTGQFTSVQTRAIIQEDLNIILNTEKITIGYGQHPETGDEYYEEKSNSNRLGYSLMNDGTFIKKGLKD